MAGYSKKPLYQKLGIKEGCRLVLIGGPPDYREKLQGPPEFSITFELAGKPDIVHLFTTGRNDLASQLSNILKFLQSGGVLWVSWPKKSAKVETDLDENIVRETVLESGLVDIKVAAVDESWSALKFVHRRG